MRGYLDLGYRVVKMKIGGAPLDEDLRRIEAVLAVVGEGEHLAVDANGRFDLPTALAYAEALAPYGLRWYEEAGDPLDYALQAELGEPTQPPLATGENLFSMQDARNLIRYGGMRPDRDCAPVRLRALLRAGRVPAHAGDAARSTAGRGAGWCRTAATRCRSTWRPGSAWAATSRYPGVFQPFGGFADGIAVEDGYVALPRAPGIGFEEKANLFAVMRELAE